MKTKLLKLMGVALTVVLLASLTVGLAGAPAGAASSNLKWIKLELPKVENWSNEATFATPEGDYWCTPGIDLGPIAQTPDGDILFAAVADGFYLGNDWFDVLKSTDGGYSWTVTGFFKDAIVAGVDTQLNGAITAGATTITVDDTSDFWGSGTIKIDNELIYYGGKTATTFTSLTRGYDGTTAATHNDNATVRLLDTSPIVDIVTSPEYSDDTTLAVATMNYVYISDDGGKTFVQLASLWAGEYITSMDMTIADDGDLALLVGTAGGPGDVYVAKGLLSWTDQNIGTYDVFACKFLPTFADDGNIGISAIVSEGTNTLMRFSFANIADGGGWGADIANAPFTTAGGDPFRLYYGLSVASMAFPDDFDAFGTGNNVVFAGITTWLDMTDPDEEDGSDAYKVICKEAGTSTAVDLDVRGVMTTLLPTATPVTSIDVCGDAEDATIMVGVDNINLTSTPMMFSVYNSQDSGDSWAPSRKGPTGGAEYTTNLVYGMATTRVLMAPDFCSTGMAYAATWGYMTDAFQRTTDGGTSWNQISIVDYGSGTAGYTIPSSSLNAYGFPASGTLWMITQVSGNYGALWGRLDGNHWERQLSYATPGVTDALNRLDVLGDGSAMFATDKAAGLIWRSTDLGATFPKKITAKTPLTTVAAVSSTTLYTGSVGEIWWSTRSGTGWTKPDDSDIPAGAAIINVSVKGDIVLVGAVGGVYISIDGGKTVDKVGTDSPFGGPTIVTSDGGFTNNGILYATTPAGTGMGVMRTAVDLANPGDAEWIKIDDYQGSSPAYDETTFVAGGPAITLPPSGILYAIDAAAVDTDEGGLWRCTNPTDDTDSSHPPYFERENRGLAGGETLGFLTPSLAPPSLAPTFFCLDSSATNYYEQVWMFTDILNVGVTLASPEKDATGVGLLPEGYVYPEVSFLWQEMAGATNYQFQIAIDADFKTKASEDVFTSSLAVRLENLMPNTTYYWRVRVADEGSILGAPLISPWSATYKFKTAIGASMARPDLQAPWPGEPDVPLSPTFEWSGIEWAEVYEYELALDPTTTAGGYFSTPLVALVGTDALVSTAWKCNTTLNYETRYYWHVKAIGVDTDTPWSDVGTFTTMSKAAPPPTAQPPVVIPPVEEITPAWIWAIVIIGAILVIAVIVLIVTTRRVP